MDRVLSIDSKGPSPIIQHAVYMARSRIYYGRKAYDKAIEMVEKASEFDIKNPNSTNATEMRKLGTEIILMIFWGGSFFAFLKKKSCI